MMFFYCKMKSTKVQTLGELCMLMMGWAIIVYPPSPASSSRRVWHGLATAVDSMRESIHAICCDFLSPQGTQSEWIRLLMCETQLWWQISRRIKMVDLAAVIKTRSNLSAKQKTAFLYFVTSNVLVIFFLHERTHGQTYLQTKYCTYAKIKKTICNKPYLHLSLLVPIKWGFGNAVLVSFLLSQLP